MTNRGHIYVFTGKGKGKTTSALGVALRAVGADERVLMVQFLKEKEASSENNVIEGIENFDLRSFGRKGFFLPEEELERKPELKEHFKPLTKKDKDLARKGLKFVREQAESENYDVIILDEACVALNFNLIEEKEVMKLINTSEVDIVITGRNCSDKIIEKADLVTRMEEVKHYFEDSQKKRKGLEY